MGVLNDPALERLLAKLHEMSDAQMQAIMEARPTPGSPLSSDDAARLKEFVSDKLVALDRPKAEFCYQLLRGVDARQVVEIGTSYGVSTIYLAAAVRDNVKASGGHGAVVGTEYESKKVEAARENLRQANLLQFVDLREGDLRETLKNLRGPVDFLLVDIWIEMARPALELVYPHLRPGAMVVCDNTEQFRDAYADYLAFIGDPSHDFRTMTLPFDGGLELSVYCPPG